MLQGCIVVVGRGLTTFDGFAPKGPISLSKVPARSGCVFFAVLLEIIVVAGRGLTTFDGTAAGQLISRSKVLDLSRCNYGIS